MDTSKRPSTRRSLKTLHLKPGDQLLKFGTGWEGLAVEVRLCLNGILAAVVTVTRSSRTQAAASYSCEVDTLTLSVEQKTLAEERIRE